MPLHVLSSPPKKTLVLFSTCVLWGLAVATLVYWTLAITYQPEAPAPIQTAHAEVAPVDLAAQIRKLANALGSPNAGHEARSQMIEQPMRLIGVVVQGPKTDSKYGAALIAIDNDSPKSFAVGDVVTGEWRLQSVSTRSVTLSNNAQTQILSLPARAP